MPSSLRPCRGSILSTPISNSNYLTQLPYCTSDWFSGFQASCCVFRYSLVLARFWLSKFLREIMHGGLELTGWFLVRPSSSPGYATGSGRLHSSADWNSCPFTRLVQIPTSLRPWWNYADTQYSPGARENSGGTILFRDVIITNELSLTSDLSCKKFVVCEQIVH